MLALTKNRVQLLDIIDPNIAFVTELGTVGAITWPQRENIINIIQPRDRNDKLLDFLTRKSVADFQQFISILSKEQVHLVPLLLTDGGETYFVSVYINTLFANYYIYTVSQKTSSTFLAVTRESTVGFS